MTTIRKLGRGEGHTRAWTWVRGIAAAMVALAVWTAAPAHAGTFGTRCAQKFQNNWQKEVWYGTERCQLLTDQLSQTDTSLFQASMKGDQMGFTILDGVSVVSGVDSVDLFYVNTHGGAFKAPYIEADDANLAFFEKDTLTQSSTWRFGNNNHKARIFSQYACETMRLDTHTWNRWNKAFKGGLYIATGSHALLYESISTNETGEDYAENLQDGLSVKWAWFDGNADWNAHQGVAVYASSSGNLSVCVDRLNLMTWQNINFFGRLRDGNMNRLCASWIDND